MSANKQSSLCAFCSAAEMEHKQMINPNCYSAPSHLDELPHYFTSEPPSDELKPRLLLPTVELCRVVSQSFLLLNLDKLEMT